jgi:hypothetical protein
MPQTHLWSLEFEGCGQREATGTRGRIHKIRGRLTSPEKPVVQGITSTGVSGAVQRRSVTFPRLGQPRTNMVSVDNNPRHNNCHKPFNRLTLQLNNYSRWRAEIKRAAGSGNGKVATAVTLGRRSPSDRQTLRFASVTYSAQDETIGVEQRGQQRDHKDSGCGVCIQGDLPANSERTMSGEFEMKAMTLTAALVVLSIANSAQAGLFGLFKHDNGCGCSVEATCAAPVDPTCAAPAACGDNSGEGCAPTCAAPVDPTCAAPAACGDNHGEGCAPTCAAPVDPTCAAPAECGDGCGNGCGSNSCSEKKSCFKMPKIKLPKLHMPKFKLPKLRLPKLNCGDNSCGSSCGTGCEPTCAAPAACGDNNGEGCAPTCAAPAEPSCAAPCDGCK